mgnify:FL=1
MSFHLFGARRHLNPKITKALGVIADIAILIEFGVMLYMLYVIL